MNKFTGKLFDDDYGLNWYYFGARYYDADVGRWWSVDPLAGKYPGYSPFNYALNNPYKFVDINGLQPWKYAKEYKTTGKGLTNHIKSIEKTVDAVHNEIAERDAIVTFTTNGKHKNNSLHYKGKAIDLRTRDLSRKQVNNIVTKLRNKLGHNYDVLIEVRHIHIEYDPKENKRQKSARNVQTQNNLKELKSNDSGKYKKQNKTIYE